MAESSDGGLDADCAGGFNLAVSVPTLIVIASVLGVSAYVSSMGSAAAAYAATFGEMPRAEAAAFFGPLALVSILPFLCGLSACLAPSEEAAAPGKDVEEGGRASIRLAADVNPMLARRGTRIGDRVNRRASYIAVRSAMRIDGASKAAALV